jgi:UrcA family protein
MMTIRTNVYTIAIAASLAAGLASPAFADETIELNRYDLARFDDADRLQRDIVVAATRECNASLANWVYQWRTRHVAACIKDAVDHTVAEVQNLGLSQLHASMDAGQRYDSDRGPATIQRASAQ